MVFNAGEKVIFTQEVDEFPEIPLFEVFEVVIGNINDTSKGFYVEFEGEAVYIASYEFGMVRKVEAL